MNLSETGLLDLTVTGFSHGGEGVARHGESGRVVFVAGALPGERVRARLDGDAGAAARWWRARTVEIIEAAGDRIPVSCPAAAAGAGCCDLAHVAVPAARELKREVLTGLLTRIGGLSPETVDGLLGPVVPLDPAIAGWRVRTRLAVDRHAHAGLRAAGSAELVTEHCSAPVAGLLDGLDELDLRPGTELMVAAGDDRRRQVAELLPAAGGRSGGGRRATQRRRGARQAARPGRTLDGSGEVGYRVGPWTWRLPVTAFWQAHRAAPQHYSETLLELLGDHRDRLAGRGELQAWDLFGGAGVFAGALLAGAEDLGVSFGGIDIVDSDRDALVAAQHTFAGAPATTRTGRIGSTVADLTAPDLVVVDPPRAGAKAGVIELVAAADPAVIAHVGCDPAAFARDLADYGTAGYRPVAMRAFDAFPNTHHVEAMALLVRP